MEMEVIASITTTVVLSIFGFFLGAGEFVVAGTIRVASPYRNELRLLRAKIPLFGLGFYARNGRCMELIDGWFKEIREHRELMK